MSKSIVVDDAVHLKLKNKINNLENKGVRLSIATLVGIMVDLHLDDIDDYILSLKNNKIDYDSYDVKVLNV